MEHKLKNIKPYDNSWTCTVWHTPGKVPIEYYQLGGPPDGVVCEKKIKGEKIGSVTIFPDEEGYYIDVTGRFIDPGGSEYYTPIKEVPPGREGNSFVSCAKTQIQIHEVKENAEYFMKNFEDICRNIKPTHPNDKMRHMKQHGKETYPWAFDYPENILEDSAAYDLGKKKGKEKETDLAYNMEKLKDELYSNSADFKKLEAIAKNYGKHTDMALAGLIYRYIDGVGSEHSLHGEYVSSPSILKEMKERGTIK